MRILITGSAGLLGKALVESAPKNIDLYCIYRNIKPDTHHRLIQFDLKNNIDLLGIKPDIIIHCAAEGNVDKIQQHTYLGVDCILNPTINIINQVKKLKCKLIYLSTNAVFDGENPPYDENHTLCPINSYGIFKAACELAVQGSDIDWVIVRPLLMYGWPNNNQRPNWASIWINKLRKQEICQVVYDVITQPLYNYSCADLIWKIVNKDISKEIFNIAGADILTLYDFARIIADEMKVDKHLIEPVPSSHFKSLAPRPRNTSYCLDKINKVLGHNPICVKDGIRKMLTDKV